MSTETTNVDFHLNCEQSPDGAALIHASWATDVPGARFQVSIEAVTDHSVNEAISFMSELQLRITDNIKTWGARAKRG